MHAACRRGARPCWAPSRVGDQTAARLPRPCGLHTPLRRCRSGPWRSRAHGGRRGRSGGRRGVREAQQWTHFGPGSLGAGVTTPEWARPGLVRQTAERLWKPPPAPPATENVPTCSSAPPHRNSRPAPGSSRPADANPNTSRERLLPLPADLCLSKMLFHQQTQGTQGTAAKQSRAL